MFGAITNSRKCKAKLSTRKSYLLVQIKLYALSHNTFHTHTAGIRNPNPPEIVSSYLLKKTMVFKKTASQYTKVLSN